MRKATIFIVLAFLLVLCAVPAYANGIPKLPHAFYGSVLINGASATVGTQISATVDIGDIISTQNPVTTVGGSYGIGGLYLLVQGYGIPDGATITFYVNGVAAPGQTAIFEAGGGPDRRDLSVTIIAPPPVGAGAPAVGVVTAVGSIDLTPYLDAEGKTTVEIHLSSADGLITIVIPVGTKMLDAEGNPLGIITIEMLMTPPPPPGYALVGPAYDCRPDGATFEPYITLTFTYDPADIPTEVSEEDLALAYWDGNEWVMLPTTVDTVANTVTAGVTHFTPFGILARLPLVPAPAAFSLSSLTVQPAEVQPKEVVTIAVSVANTGGAEGSYTVVLKINGVTEAEKSVTIAAGGSETVTFSVTKEDAASYSVTVDGLIGSFTVVVTPSAPAAFSVSNLSIQPVEVLTGEAATISVAVANTGGTEGSYTVVLNINGVKEAEKTVTIAAGGSETVTFSVTKEDTARYSVTIDGLSGSFTVVAPAINWPLIGGIIGGVIVVGLLVFFLVFRRRAY